MKKRLAQADCDIDLALQYKNDYPEIAKVQYNASVEEMNQFRSQHEAIVQLISNLQQSQYLLSQMGRFVAWAGSDSQAATIGT